MNRTTSRRSFKTWLLLGFLEGLVALFLLLRAPSMSGSAVLLGYSAGRVALAGLLLLAVTLLGILVLSSLQKGVFFERLSVRLHQNCLAEERNFTRFALAAGYLFLLTGGVLLASQLWLGRMSPDNMTNLDAARVFSLWQASYRHAAPLYLWVCLLAGQGLVGLLAARPSALRVISSQWRAAMDALFLLLAFTLLAFYWTLLVLGINLFSLLPGWHWEMRRAEVTHPWLAVASPLLVLLVAWLAQRLYLRRKKSILPLALLFLAGTAYQLSFALLSPQGLGSLSAPYANSWHALYAQQAVQERPVIEIIRSYESDYAEPYYFAMTKPPGVMVFYAWMERLAGWIHPVQGEADRLVNLLRFITFVFPLLAMLPVVLLYRLSCMLEIRAEHALLPSIFYLCIPGVILMQLFLDQALYPALFLAGAMLAVRLCRRPSGWLALGLGVYLFTAVFFSFSLLALVPFVVLLVAAFLLARHKRPPLPQVLRLALLVVAGAGLAYLVFRYLIGYDFFTRLQNAMLSHSADSYGMRGETGINRWTALLVNNTEMGMWVGVPLFLAFLWEGLRGTWRFLKHRADRPGLFNAAALAAYLALNVQGGTYGEVGRLWLFLAPLFALAAAVRTPRLFAREQLGVLLIMVLQLATVSLIYQCQGYNP